MKTRTLLALFALLCLSVIPVFAQTAAPTVPASETMPDMDMSSSANSNLWNLAGTDAVGYVRFAHVSADAPAVDIYVPELSETAVVSDLEFGEVTDFIYVPQGNFTYVARTAGSDADSAPVASVQWDVPQDTSWLVVVAGLMSNLSVQVEPVSLLRDDIAENASRVRLINYISGAPALTIASNTGESFGAGLGWVGIFDGEFTPGTYNLTVTSEDGTALLTDTTVDLAPHALTTLLVLGSADGSRPAEIVAFDSPADMSRVQFVNNGTAAVDIFVRPGDEQIVSNLAPGATSEWVLLSSGSVTFVTYVPGTGPTGQELGAWIGAVKPNRDLVITFMADNTADEGDPVFSNETEAAG